MAQVSKRYKTQIVQYGHTVARKEFGAQAYCRDIYVLKTEKRVRFFCRADAKSIDDYVVYRTFAEIKSAIAIDIQQILKNEKKNRMNTCKKSEKQIKVTCYNKTEVWSSREDAKAFYLDCMACSEGAERTRYTNIYIQLTQGCFECYDIIDG